MKYYGVLHPDKDAGAIYQIRYVEIIRGISQYAHDT